MGYKILGFTVWRGAKWYLHRRYGRWVPSRKLVAAGVVAAAVASVIAVGAKRDSGA